MRVRNPVAAIFFSACGCAGAASAQSLADFYRGKTLNIVVPADPGGSYDLYARMIARHMPKYIPGNPNIVVQNMPGGGGLRAVDYMLSVAPKDGTALAIPIQDILLTEVLGGHGVTYKAADFNWIGRMSYTIDITIAWHESRVKSIPDAREISIPVAGTGPTSATVMNHVVANNVLGTKFKIVAGYKASNDMLAAVERREVDASFSSWTTLKASYPHWIAEKKINILTAYGKERFAQLPDVPAIFEYARNADERAILELISSTGFVGRALLTTPGAPAERVAALRGAFQAMLKDAEFLDMLTKAQAEFAPLTGEAMQDFARTTRELSPALVEKARASVKP